MIERALTEVSARRPQLDGGVVPPVNTNNIPFGWDIVFVAAFSLIIYYWAMRAKLPREEMLALVSRQNGEQERLDAGIRH